MSEPETAQEPTMEEILASIRRIISEDDGGTAEATPEEVEVAEVEVEEVLTEEPVHQEMVQEESEQPLQDPPQMEERETSNPDSERYASITAVFSGRQREQADELDEFDDEYDAQAEPEAENVAVFEPTEHPEPESFGESQYETEEPSVDDVEAFFGNDNDEAAPDFTKTDFGEPVSIEEQVAAAATHEVSFEAAAQEVIDDEVLSADTEDRVASLLGQLNETQPSSDPAPSSAEASSVEGMVREMLRPMLQSWLDENLPPLVERIVEREIKRVTRAR